jgi:uncharacterized RDD family membrane protein YckC
VKLSPTFAVVETNDGATAVTPEGLSIDLPIAGLGSRSIATFIDHLIQFMLLLAVGGIVSATSSGEFSSASVAIIAAWLFILMFFYPILFEVLWSGRTPGKRFNGLRVVTVTGAPIGFRESAIRNLARIIDYLPSFYVLGLLTVGTSGYHQRIGDFAAGTVVIFEPTKLRVSRKARRQNRKAGLVDTANAAEQPELALVDVSAITPQDLAAIRTFFDRRNALGPADRLRLADQFAVAIRPKVAGVPSTVTNEDFLEWVVAAKSARM